MCVCECVCVCVQGEGNIAMSSKLAKSLPLMCSVGSTHFRS